MGRRKTSRKSEDTWQNLHQEAEQKMDKEEGRERLLKVRMKRKEEKRTSSLGCPFSLRPPKLRQEGKVSLTDTHV